jgi:hypothetical protein
MIFNWHFRRLVQPPLAELPLELEQQRVLLSNSRCCVWALVTGGAAEAAGTGAWSAFSISTVKSSNCLANGHRVPFGD